MIEYQPSRRYACYGTYEIAKAQERRCSTCKDAMDCASKDKSSDENEDLVEHVEDIRTIVAEETQDLKYETRTLSVIVRPYDHPNYSEMSTTITIVDDGCGEFVEVAQDGRPDFGKIGIDPEEWPTLLSAINRMILECRSKT